MVLSREQLLEGARVASPHTTTTAAMPADGGLAAEVPSAWASFKEGGGGGAGSSPPPPPAVLNIERPQKCRRTLAV